MSGKLLKNKAAGKFWETDISDEQLEAELLTGREERICRLEQMIVKQTMPKPVPKPGTPSSKVRNSQYQRMVLPLSNSPRGERKAAKRSLKRKILAVNLTFQHILVRFSNAFPFYFVRFSNNL